GGAGCRAKDGGGTERAAGQDGEHEAARSRFDLFTRDRAGQQPHHWSGNRYAKFKSAADSAARFHSPAKDSGLDAAVRDVVHAESAEFYLRAGNAAVRRSQCERSLPKSRKH